MIGLFARRVYKIRDKHSVLKRPAKPLSRANLLIRFNLHSRHVAWLPIIEGYPRSRVSRRLFRHDTVRYGAALSNSTPPETIDTPDILLMLSEDVIVFDNVKGAIDHAC